MIPNPRKNITVDFAINKLKSVVDLISNRSGGKYKMFASREEINMYTFESYEFLNLGVYIDVNFTSLSVDRTTIDIEVRRKIGSFDQPVEISNSNRHIINLIDLIRDLVILTDDDILSEKENIKLEKNKPIQTEKEVISQLAGQIKKATITSLILGGIFLVLIFLYSLMGVILMDIGVSSDATSYIVGMMPFINGAFHADLGHLFGNLLVLFLFLIPEVNQRYDLKKLFWLSCVLSTLYIPIFVLGISLPMVGSSGVFMFLIGRFFFSRKWKIFPIILSIYVFFEIMAIPTNDGLAHIFHAMCTIIGIMTVTRFNKWIPEEINKLIA